MSDSIHGTSAQSDDEAVDQAQRQPRPPPGFPISSYQEQGSLWAWSTSLEDTVFESVNGEIRGLSCYQYGPPHLGPVITNTRLEESGLQAWLGALSPLNDRTQPCGGYQILHINQPGSGIIPMKSETFEVITKAFDLPPVELHLQSEKSGGCGMFFEYDRSFIFVTRKPAIIGFASSVLRYDPSTNITKGYIVTNLTNGRAHDIFNNLHHQFLACPHPLLIPISLMELSLEIMSFDLDRCSQHLLTIERYFGLSPWSNDEQPEVGHYNKLVKDLARSHSTYSLCQWGVMVAKLGIQSYLKNLKRLDTDLPDDCQHMLRAQSLRLSDRLEYILSCIEHDLVFGNMATRLQSQQTALFNLMTQADTNVNIGLAKDSRELAAASKQDSSAMKIIAFLTTLFLPGTFIAVSFPHPTISFSHSKVPHRRSSQWQAPTLDQVTTPHYWFYWAITGPITLITMIIVLSWTIWRARQNRIMISKARDSKIGDASGSEGGSEGRSGRSDASSFMAAETEMSMKEKLVGLLRRRRGKNVLPRDVGDTDPSP